MLGFKIILFTKNKCRRKLPGKSDALLMQIPLTIGHPWTPSNRIKIVPSSLTDTLKSTNCIGLFPPTIEKISRLDKTCNSPIDETF